MQLGGEWVHTLATLCMKAHKKVIKLCQREVRISTNLRENIYEQSQNLLFQKHLC